MEDYVVKGGKRLRRGYTTGSCAAAAAKAAALMLLTGRKKETVSLLTPAGTMLELAVTDIELCADRVSCAIVKDSGDDPDVTNGIRVTATVTRTDVGITIDGGVGVGRVTKPGLDQPVGAAAINSVPRKMIEENVLEVCRTLDYPGGLNVIISVPTGEELADRTFNPRLGIVGGISVLGTTGIVEPMSEQALVDTIQVELRQRRAQGSDYVLLTPGNYGAEFIKLGLDLDPETAVLTSNFLGDTLDFCRELGFRGALLVGHIGKLVKCAGNMLNTHSKYGDCRMEILTAHAAACGLDAATAETLLDCATCDDALRILGEQGLDQPVLKRVLQKAEDNLRRRAGDLELGLIVFSRDSGLLIQSENAEKLQEQIKRR